MKHRIVTILVRLIRLYQKTAPSWIRRSCRYTPTCSEYAILVISEKGAIVGLLLSILRVLRCIPPFGGIDWPGSVNKNCDGIDDCSQY
ncbi:MAG: membrane protein insertion efficiency factor YidD [Planctomycetota bacterium]